ncbi:PucR family transcriptional regulator [Prauserella oleivorans]|uniref:PucR family transcriptional regulator n=1 Tax=Prauserella oleivorans TaxID=1478153 RepID=A0ABW5WE05_9PSEU
MRTLDPTGAPPIRVLDVLGWADGLRLVGRPVGLDREVRWAQASDLLDPAPYLRGAELVLVTGLSLRSEDECVQFVRALVPACPAAIGYAVGVVHDTAPEALVREANRAGIPVFEVPPTVPFVHFTERLARERLLYRERAENGYLLELVRTGRARPDALLERAAFLHDDVTDLGVTAVAADSVGRLPMPERALVGDLGERVVLLYRLSGLPSGYPRGVACGISGPGELADVPRLIEQALSALDLARRNGVPATAADLASLEALARCLPEGYLQPFRRYLYEPLARYDRVHNACLVETLRVLIRCGGSVTECGRRMFLHPNTVRKRLRRVHVLTGKDPAVPTDLAALSLCLPEPVSR